MFEEKPFMDPIRKFLVSYPGLKSGETLEVDYMKVDPYAPMGIGSAVTFVGTNRADRHEDIIGNSWLNEQANLTLIIRRFTNDNELRRDIGDFIYNYIRWINYENEMRDTAKRNPLLPHLGNTDDEIDERITANGGMHMGGTSNLDVDEFQLQIQIAYTTIFESEEY